MRRMNLGGVPGCWNWKLGQLIYEEVWGEEYFYDDSNIMAIISRLRKKLEVNPSSPKYIQTVKGIGYRFNKEV